MTTDSVGLTDTAEVELNHPEPAPGAVASVPSRPTGDDRGEWVDYCVALGADRYFLDNSTTHTVVAPTEESVTIPPRTLEELRELATKFGG